MKKRVVNDKKKIPADFRQDKTDKKKVHLLNLNLKLNHQQKIFFNKRSILTDA